MRWIKWVLLIVLAWLPGVASGAADYVSDGANSIINIGVYNNVTISHAGIIPYKVTIKGVLTVNESVELRSCIVDGTVVFGTDADNVIRAWCTAFSQSEATIEDSGTKGFVTDELDPEGNSTNDFSTDCGLDSKDRPSNPACHKCDRSDAP